MRMAHRWKHYESGMEPEGNGMYVYIPDLPNEVVEKYIMPFQPRPKGIRTDPYRDDSED